MPKPRKELVLLKETPYYHCVSRCVRRAFLCGVDTVTGKSYEHRRQWIVDRIKQLTDIFAIDCASYSVMSNHYHVIPHVDTERADAWSEQEVIDRWVHLFSLPVIVQRYLAKEPITQAERDTVSELLFKWRTRLHDISWFMRCINEPIARQANKEDGCTGRYWEGRYKSQALLDEKALAACLAYVDLNPVRAGMTQTPEQSEYTSIKARIHARGGIGDENRAGVDALPPLWILPVLVEAGEHQQRRVSRLNAVRLLARSLRPPLEIAAGRKAARNAGLVATVSARALSVR
jgi:hypothetical protein